MNSNYLNPKWQKKRLEVLQRHEFKCQWCNSENKELHVHHVYYLQDIEIWDYEDRYYMVLCSDCHEIFHQMSKLFCAVLSESNEEGRKIIKSWFSEYFKES